MSNLDRDLAEARKLGYGVWYGRYKADHPSAPEVMAPEVQLPCEEDPAYGCCPVCGKRFKKFSRMHRYCSGECKEVANRRRTAAKYHANAPVIHQQECPHCAKVFLPSHRRQKYCCSDCRLDAERQRKRCRKNNIKQEAKK